MRADLCVNNGENIMLRANGGTATARALDWLGELLGRDIDLPATVDRIEGVRGADLALHPIEPEWIEDGQPVARAVTLTESPDKRLSSGIWECTRGKFKWIYGVDEIVHVLDGETTITEEGEGKRYTLRAGDVAYFPLGLVTHWEIDRYLRKFFVVRVPGGNRHVARARQRLAI